MTLLSGAANALPAGGQVSGGQASIATTGTQTTVHQSSERAVIDWQSFNVGQGEKVRFIDPNSAAVTLNRVQGPGSTIDGQLLANGNVWIINPNGILFGRNAQVNVGGLLATTSAISNADFMAGNYRFTPGGNSGATVENDGSITLAQAGLAAFVAPGVINSGTIEAKLGKVEMGSGDGFTLDLYGDGLINLTASPAVSSQLVANHGAIAADGGTISLTAAAAGSVVDSLINMDGFIEADAVGGQSGSVTLAGSHRTDVSGAISAQGGSVETSGEMLAVSGTVKAKSWLLDPNNVMIQSSGSDTNVSGNPNFTTTDDSAIVTTGSIETALNNGTSVTIATGSAGANSQAGDIEVASSISKTAGGDASLTLDAYRNITVDSNVQISSTSGKLNVTFDANDANAGSGEILMNIGSGITSNGGNIVLGGGINPLTGSAVGNAYVSSFESGIDLENTTLQAGGGNITLNGSAVTNASSSDIVGVSLDNSTLATSGGGNISITGTEGSYGIYAIFSTEQTTAGSISLNGTAGSGFGSIGIGLLGGQVSTASGNITIDGTSGNVSGGAISVGIDDQAEITSTSSTAHSSSITLDGQAGTSDYASLGVYLSPVPPSIKEISSVTADISITGHASGSPTNIGVQLVDSPIESTGTGAQAATISINGTGSNGGVNYFGGSSSDGISLIGEHISSVDGNIAINGTSAGNYGIQFGVGSTIQSTGRGLITLTGSGSTAIACNSASLNDVCGGSSIIGSAGNITLQGDSLDLEGLTTSTSGSLILTPLTTSMSIATDTSGNAAISNSAGDIEIAGNIEQAVTGTGNLTFSAYRDITVDSGVQIAATSGKLNVTLDANADAAGSGAIFMNTGSGITSNGGNIILGGGATGAAMGDATYNNGISLDDVTLNAGGGNITMNGSGYSSSSQISSGIYTYGNSLIETSGSGNIVMNGVGGSSTGTNGDENDGITLSDSIFTTQNGNITLTGTAGSRGSGLGGVNGIINAGILAYYNTIHATGNGSVILSGTGGIGNTSDNEGLLIDGDSAHTVQTGGSGGLILAGRGGTGDDSDNTGIYLNAPLRTTGSGNIALNGTGGTGNTGTGNFGIDIKPSGFIEALGTGSITLTGVNGSGNASNAGLDNEGTVQAAAGNITLAADSMALDNGGTVTTTGAITLEPNAPGTTMGIGSGAGTLSIDDAMLATLSYGSLTLGGIHTGAMNIDSGVTFNAPVVFQTGSDRNISLGRTLASTATGTSFTFVPGGDFINTAGADALMPGTGGRYLVYTSPLAANVFDGITFDYRINGCSYGSPCPSLPASGNVLIEQPLSNMETLASEALPVTVFQTLLQLNRQEVTELNQFAAQNFPGTTPVPAPVFIDTALLQELGQSDSNTGGWWNGVVH